MMRDDNLQFKMKDKVLKAIDNMRPFLQADNGDVELIDITEDAIVKVRLTGACAICPLSQITLRAGVERSLMREIPAIRRVEAVYDQ
jgi:Fe-S cluster biogenesis protein NfuA